MIGCRLPVIGLILSAQIWSLRLLTDVRQAAGPNHVILAG